jgi:DNA end-binding protein Ku
MFWPDEIRTADFGGVDVTSDVRDQELTMARQLIDSLTSEWAPEQYHDVYRDALVQIVEAKLNGEEIEVVEPEPAAKVVDLMEALKASVDAAKKDAGSAKPAAKKKAAAKKPATKKPAAKKPAARKKAVGE